LSLFPRGHAEPQDGHRLLNAAADTQDLWNAYFDAHDVDFILTPSLWADATVYTDTVRQARPLSVKQKDGNYTVQIVPKPNGAFWGAFKLWAVPKMVVPLGLDSAGRPVSCTAWGKAVPKANLCE
jgi:Asp-tRNA(Asn)/Glu-tRNA(Gln) amidotransferase A subunit family amidase